MSSQTGGKFYAFLYQNESANLEGNASLLRFEVVRTEWFRRVWAELREAGLPVAAVQAELPRVGGSDFALGGLRAETRRALYAVHRAFAARTTDPLDPAPVGLLEALVPHDVLRPENIREGDWFEVHLAPGERLDELRNPEREGEAILGMLGDSEDEDEPPTVHPIDRLGPPGMDGAEWVVPVLPAVHFPQTPLADDDDRRSGPLEWLWVRPDGEIDEGGTPVAAGPEGPGPRPRGTGEKLAIPAVFVEEPRFRECDQHVCTCRRAAVDRCIPQWRRRQWASAPGGGGDGGGSVEVTAPVTADTTSVSVQVQPYLYGAYHPAASRAPQKKVLYQGRGGVHGMQVTAPAPIYAPAPPAAPAAAPGDYQPFVGANRIGAGNNVALWDDHGRLAAYVDYGFPAPANRNTWPAGADDPCVCSDPLMVLTHWDYDHYAMVRRVPGALRLRWVAPEAGCGPVATREIYQPLLKNVGLGARLYLWEEPDGHVVAPFGVLVRADGPTVNDNGIVAYVRAEADPKQLPVSPQLAGRESTRPLIAVGRLSGEWIDGSVAAPFMGNEVVVPAAVAGEFAAPGAAVEAGDEVELAKDLAGRWIPPVGVPCKGGGWFVPSAGMGGWAISARDFVRSGGCIVDFPDAGTGCSGARVYSPTPSAGWVWNYGRAASQTTMPEDGLPREDGTTWEPVWGLDLGTCRIEPAPKAARRLDVDTGRPVPLYRNARWLLLPGDAGFQHIPPQRAAAAMWGAAVTPRVVGLVASHHGSATWISRPPNDAGDLACIPVPSDEVQQVVYAYGTRSGKKSGKHCYAHRGKNGHPHVRAIKGYEAKGWGAANPTVPGLPFGRLNTAPEDYRSRQPFNPLKVPAQPLSPAVYAHGHRSGDVALGWDSAADTPLQCDHVPAGVAPVPALASDVLLPIRRRCQGCGQVRDYYF